MILNYRHIPLTPEYIQSVVLPLYNYTKETDKESCGLRDADYAFAIHYANVNKDDVLLDVGCGMSYLFLYLAQFVKKSFGIDDIAHGDFTAFTPKWFRTIWDYNEMQAGQANFINANAKELPFKNEYFDKIFTFSALEHFKNEDDIDCVKEIYRCLKPGGLFLGSVDYNPIAEYPVPDNNVVRCYTHESFYRRIVHPSGLQLYGIDYCKDNTIPESVNYIATSLLFILRKEV